MHSKEPWARCLELLADEGVAAPSGLVAGLERHVEEVRRFNRVLSLVSRADADLLESVHVPDSLSLAPWVLLAGGVDGTLVDIGSGGGFPGIVLALVFPDRPVVLVDRSEKKAGFLQKLRGALGLERVRVVTGEFPRTVSLEGVSVVTARAVEQAPVIQRAILERLPPGATFLSQSGHAVQGELFHVEQVEDAWSRAGLRRGLLERVQRR